MPTQTLPSNQNQYLDTYGQILNIRQAQQNLQTGQFLQQQAQATAQEKAIEAQQAQQNWTIRNNVSDYWRKDDPSKYDAHGIRKMDVTSHDLYQIAGPQADQYIQAAAKTAQDQTDLYTHTVGLSEAERDQAARAFSGGYADPKIVQNFKTPTDILNYDESLTKGMPEAVKALGKSMLATAPIPKLQDGQSQYTPEQLDEFVHDRQNLIRPILAASTISEQVTPKEAVRNTGAAVVSGTTAPALQGAGFKGKSATPLVLGPTDLPAYKQAAAAASTGGAAGAQNEEALYKNIVQQGVQATQVKSLSQDVQHFAKEVQTGEYSKQFANKWAVAAQTMGLSPENMTAATRRQILSKMSAQLKIQSESGATTDNERAGIESAMPDPEHMTPEAVQQAARYVGAQADVKASRAQIANVHRQLNGGVSSGLQGADSQFMQHADPRIFEYQSIPAGKERQAYLKSHFSSAAEVQAFLDNQKQLKGYGAIR